MCKFCFGDANDPEEKHVCNWGFPDGAVVKNLPANAGDAGSNSWVGKIPWRRKWQPTPVFLPGEYHG